MRVVVAEDSVLLREGLVRVLEDSDFEVVGQTDDAVGLMRSVEATRPDLVITDIKMPPTHTDEGLRAAEKIRAEYADTAVLVLSQYVDASYAMKLMNSGERVGYLLKDRVGRVDEFIDAIRRVAAGGTVVDPGVVEALLEKPRRESPVDRLSAREREILALMAEGRTNAAIGETLFVSPKTVETHIGNIFSKLGLPPSNSEHRRVLAVLAFLRN